MTATIATTATTGTTAIGAKRLSSRGSPLDPLQDRAPKLQITFCT